MEPREHTILDELYETRILMFIESGPQSNKYHQLYFTEEEFRILSRAIGRVMSKDGKVEFVQYFMSDKTYPLPDLKQINEKKP
jgi:hypothetical protein